MNTDLIKKYKNSAGLRKYNTRKHLILANTLDTQMVTRPVFQSIIDHVNTDKSKKEEVLLLREDNIYDHNLITLQINEAFNNKVVKKSYLQMSYKK